MKKYKAMVKDSEENMIVKIVEGTARNKSEFIRDLRKNGYVVNTLKVKESSVFDKIIETNLCDWDWRETR